MVYYWEGEQPPFLRAGEHGVEEEATARLKNSYLVKHFLAKTAFEERNKW